MCDNECCFQAPKATLNEGGNSSSYAYHHASGKDLQYVYLDKETVEPVCFVPVASRSWLGQYAVAIWVRRLTAQGLKASDIRKSIRAKYPAYNAAHLGQSVYKKTFEGALKTSLQFEAQGRNARPDEALCVPDHPELMAFAFSTKSAKRR